MKRETAAEARARVTALLATGEPDRELAEAEPALRAAADEMAEADRRGAEAMRGDGIVVWAIQHARGLASGADEALERRVAAMVKEPISQRRRRSLGRRL